MFCAAAFLLTAVGQARADERPAGEPAVQESSPDTRPEDVPPEQPVRAAHETLGLRLGFLASGLFDSKQGRPFVYLDTGLRYKAQSIYFDLKLPAFVAAIDFASYGMQRLLGIHKPFDLFEAANKPIQYGSYLEPAHLRLGESWDLAIGGPQFPLRVTAGVFSLAEFVFFDIALYNQHPDHFNPSTAHGAQDPYVVAAGGFVGVGGDAPHVGWDLALGAGPDVYDNRDYQPSHAWVLYADAEVAIDPFPRVGTYIRMRISTYTSESVVTMITSFGVNLPLL